MNNDENIYSIKMIDSFIDNNIENNENIFYNDIHITLVTNGRKSITCVYGITFEKNKLKEITKPLKKHLCCSCSIKEIPRDNLYYSEKSKYFLKLSGDHRYELTEILLHYKIITNDNKVYIHGE